MSDLLVISDVHKVYGSCVKTTALAGINLRIKASEFVALIGESGCGKTTLLNLIGGLDQPTHGSIVIEGKDITGMSEVRLAALRLHKIGVVFQFFNLLPMLTAQENIEIALMMANQSEATQRQRSRELLDIMGLSHKHDAKPFELSGGEQQRVAIARALANNPRIILMDEPTGNLDSKTSGELMKYIQLLHKGGSTIVLATHDMQVARYADRVVVLKDGEISSIDAKK